MRSISFMEENGMGASFVLDGNDWQSTHIVVYADDEPVGTVRIRWFRDFAQFERTSFRAQWRNPFVIKACAQFAFAHVARKGFDKVITHANPRYALLWRKLLGFRVVEGKEPLLLEGHPDPYVELEKILDIPANVLGPATNAEVLFRVEGSWDEPGKQEAVR
ncbi:hypothetical protein [Consotaella aegiceratis]|uniref:hypothetical protein n=1 Tax=Consotaella aegiceratis TaxID=3097961 RepID=UPI002F3EBA5D